MQIPDFLNFSPISGFQDWIKQFSSFTLVRTFGTFGTFGFLLTLRILSFAITLGH